MAAWAGLMEACLQAAVQSLIMSQIMLLLGLSAPQFTVGNFIDLLSERLNHSSASLSFPLPLQALKSTGLRTGDPRLKECMEKLKVTVKTTSDGALDRHLFKK